MAERRGLWSVYDEYAFNELLEVLYTEVHPKKLTTKGAVSALGWSESFGEKGDGTKVVVVTVVESGTNSNS